MQVAQQNIRSRRNSVCSLRRLSCAFSREYGRSHPPSSVGDSRTAMSCCPPAVRTRDPTHRVELPLSSLAGARPIRPHGVGCHSSLGSFYKFEFWKAAPGFSPARRWVWVTSLTVWRMVVHWRLTRVLTLSCFLFLLHQRQSSMVGRSGRLKAQGRSLGSHAPRWRRRNTATRTRPPLHTQARSAANKAPCAMVRGEHSDGNDLFKQRGEYTFSHPVEVRKFSLR